MLNYKDLETIVKGDRLFLSSDDPTEHMMSYIDVPASEPQSEPINTFDPESLWFCVQCILRISGMAQKYSFSECRANYKNVKLKVTTVQLIAMVTEAAEVYVVEEVQFTDIQSAPNTIYVVCQKQLCDAGMWMLDMSGSRYLMNHTMMPLFRHPKLIICDTYATYYQMRKHKAALIDLAGTVFSVIPDLQLLENICSHKENHTVSQEMTLPIMSVDMFQTATPTQPKIQNVGDALFSPDTVTLTLCQREVSVLIGLNGVRLNELRNTTGCLIKVHGAERQNNLMSRKHSRQQVSISGPKPNVAQALQSMQSLIMAYRTNPSFI